MLFCFAHLHWLFNLLTATFPNLVWLMVECFLVFRSWTHCVCIGHIIPRNSAHVTVRFVLFERCGAGMITKKDIFSKQCVE